jgi:hypothetical protein
LYQERRRTKRRYQMTKFAIALGLILAMSGAASAASIVNRDADPQTVVVTEGGDKSELTVGPGESVDFCSGGCFVTMPNGDRQALTGSETVEISGGSGTIK